MTSPTRTRLTPCIAVAVSLIATVLLGGCTSTESPPAGQAVSRQEILDQLGPFPEDTAWSSAEREQALNDADDAYWSRVAALHPNAVRPSVARVAESSEEDAESTLATCLTDGGVSLEGTTAREFTPITEAENLTWYTCKVRYPALPRPPISEEQLGYLYDYLTLFVAPCLAERGSEQPTPPTRKDFIENWPNQNWFPTSTKEIGSAEQTADYEACPTSIGGY